MSGYILDAGPLIALFNRNDAYHEWAVQTLPRLPKPLLSCPEAMAEAAAMTGQPARVVELIQDGTIQLALNLQEQTGEVLRLLRKYADQPMDLADACIVRLSELHPKATVVTLDRTDFAVYRRHGRDPIPILSV